MESSQVIGFARANQKWKRSSNVAVAMVSDMSNGPTREEIDAKIELASARTDNKITHLEGKIDLVLARMDHSNSILSAKFDEVIRNNVETRQAVREASHSTRRDVWVVGVGVLVIIAAILAAFPSFFGMGVQVKDIATQAARDVVATQAPAPAKQTAHH